MRGNQLVSDQKKSATHSLKLQIMKNYFMNQQKQFDQAFIDDIFKLASDDSQMESIVEQHAIKLLLSCQQIASVFMLRLLSFPKFRPIAINFLKDVIYLKITIYNKPFQLFILDNLLQTLKMSEFNNQQSLRSSLIYIALKIRSFDLSVRVTAIKALRKIAERLDRKSKHIQIIFKEFIPQMIQKQKIAKEVSYTKGLFLHALEDEFSQVRKNCIKILILFRTYFKPEDIKTIIIYMLNDQHQIVREQALIATKTLVDQLVDNTFNKEDLDTILMCLKQKRSNMRKLVYQTLSEAQFLQPSLLLQLIQKIFTTLVIYKADKKSIYRMLFKIGQKYQKVIESMIDKLAVVEDQQPNWKNITYKGKMILCYHWWSNNQLLSSLPNYFSRHMLYIKDMEAYLFTQKCNTQQQQSMLNISNMPIKQLLRFVQCEQSLSQDFHKTILNTLHHILVGQHDEKLINVLEELQLQYDLGPEQLLIKNGVLSLLMLKQHGRTEQMVTLIVKCLENREKYYLKGQQIRKNKCSISKTQPNCIISSKFSRFQQKIYLKCLKHHLISSTPKIEYKRLVECVQTKQDQNFVYWSLRLNKYCKIECVMKTEDQERVLDVYEMDYRG